LGWWQRGEGREEGSRSEKLVGGDGCGDREDREQLENMLTNLKQQNLLLEGEVGKLKKENAVFVERLAGKET